MLPKGKEKWPLIWTDLAKSDIDKNLDYLKLEWGQSVLLNFLLRLAESLELVSSNPSTFQIIHKRLNVRRFILNKRITLYYQLRKKDILLVTFWNNSMDPKKLRKAIRNIGIVKRNK